MRKWFHIDMSFVFLEPINKVFNECTTKQYLDEAWDYILQKKSNFPYLYILSWCFIHVKRQISYVIGQYNLNSSIQVQRFVTYLTSHC